MKRLGEAVFFSVICVAVAVGLIVVGLIALVDMVVSKKPAKVPKILKRTLGHVLDDTSTVNLLRSLRKAKERETTLDQLSGVPFIGCAAIVMPPVVTVDSEERTQAEKTAEGLLQSCERRGIENWKIQAFLP